MIIKMGVDSETRASDGSYQSILIETRWHIYKLTVLPVPLLTGMQGLSEASETNLNLKTKTKKFKFDRDMGVTSVPM